MVLSLSEPNVAVQAQLATALAKIQVLERFVGQLFSSPKILAGQGSEDTADHDKWMMSNYPAEVLIPMAALNLIAETDDREDIKSFLDVTLRGFKGIGGFASKQGENISIGIMGGGSRGKIVKRPGAIARNTYNRGWERKAREEGAEIAE